MNIKKGVKLLDEIKGDGSIVQRLHHYILAIRIQLNKGDIVATPDRCLSRTVDEVTRVHPDGFFEHRVRIDRENLIAGVFYAVQGMRVGGYRKVAISPHLAYGEKGIADVIPPNAKLIVEIKVIKEY